MASIYYGLSSSIVAFSILALMLLAMEAGHRVGVRARPTTKPESRAQIETVQTSLLGLLALMLGFTFSISLDRHNSRSQAVVSESNAIGTAFLRTELLPEQPRAAARRAFADYADLRARMSVLTWNERAEEAVLEAGVLALQDTLWKEAAANARTSPVPPIAGQYVQALNDMIDAYSSYKAEMYRHVPFLVILLLFGAFVVSGAIIGFSAGLAGHRPARATFLMVSVVVLLLYMVMDLDRPHRGVIQVSSQSLLDLKAEIDAAVPR